MSEGNGYRVGQRRFNRDASKELVGSAWSASPPLTCQWRFKGEPLAGQVEVRLVIPAVGLEHEGGYDLVATDSSGSVTSRVARLTVDPTFVVVRDGPIVTDSEGTLGYGWADYDGDGDLDLLVANAATAQDRCSLYRNQGDGSFVKVTDVAPVTKPGCYGDVSWGDYDNDGYVDLFVANGGNEGPTPQFLYRNQGDGRFAGAFRAGIGHAGASGPDRMALRHGADAEQH
jgi:hypothetical protein